ncbi:hypothetical protein E2C01_002213 [Portunus trituberculatus]|uniref:Uncharacterized protein n=1 Tax=Portunus trituberculatus TaxID=210409 RepID=A0A5B7CJ50_PORTR|nr:hypothetical protein [Portunus trituberculatus]
MHFQTCYFAGCSRPCKVYHIQTVIKVSVPQFQFANLSVKGLTPQYTTAGGGNLGAARNTITSPLPSPSPSHHITARLTAVLITITTRVSQDPDHHNTAFSWTARRDTRRSSSLGTHTLARWRIN